MHARAYIRGCRSQNVFTSFLHSHHCPDGARGGRPEDTASIMLGAEAAILLGLSSSLLTLSVAVVFIFMFPPECNWILEHIHVVINVVWGAE